ncbi:MAG: VOC family protein [Bacteroidota bacterium]
MKCVNFVRASLIPIPLPMRKLGLFFAAILLSHFSYGQVDREQDLQFRFISLIVKDVSSSVEWYTKVMGFSLEKEFVNEERGLKIANLSKGEHGIELIEISSSVSPEDAIPNFSKKLRIHGIFKVGFGVKDFDTWIEKFHDKNVEFQGEVVQDPVNGSRMVVVLDPDGNRIQFFERTE